MKTYPIIVTVPENRDPVTEEIIPAHFQEMRFIRWGIAPVSCRNGDGNSVWLQESCAICIDQYNGVQIVQVDRIRFLDKID